MLKVFVWNISKTKKKTIWVRLQLAQKRTNCAEITWSREKWIIVKSSRYVITTKTKESFIARSLLWKRRKIHNFCMDKNLIHIENMSKFLAADAASAALGNAISPGLLRAFKSLKHILHSNLGSLRIPIAS